MAGPPAETPRACGGGRNWGNGPSPYAVDPAPSGPTPSTTPSPAPPPTTPQAAPPAASTGSATTNASTGSATITTPPAPSSAAAAWPPAVTRIARRRASFVILLPHTASTAKSVRGYSVFPTMVSADSPTASGGDEWTTRRGVPHHLHRRELYWQSAQGTPPSATARRSALGPFGCLSETSGVTCSVASGRGFLISSSGITPVG